MIRRDDISITEVLEHLRTMDSEFLPTPVEGVVTDQQRAEIHAEVKKIATATPDHIRTHCIGCDADVAISETAMCECGGFVCVECQRIEEDGVCNHVRPSFLPEDDEDTEDV